MSFASKKKWALYASVVALSVSSLAVGLLVSMKLGALDRRYSHAMERNLRAVFLARDLSRNTAEAHRSLINLAVDKLASDPAARRAPSEEATFQIGKFAQMRAANEHLFTELEPLAGNAIAPLLEEVRTLRFAYLQRAETLLRKLKDGDETGAAAYRIAEVRPAFDRYLAAQDRFADAILDRAKSANVMLSAESRRWQRVSVGISGWPFAVAAFVILVMAIALVWVLRGVKDEPAR